MLKKLTLLAMAVAAMAALAIPAAASAGWTANGVELKSGENPHVLFEGTAQFSNALLGSVHCSQATATIQLTGGTLDGHVKSFTADNLSTACVTTGFIKSSCGEKSLTFVGLEGTPTATATVGKKLVDFTGVKLINKFGAEGKCLTITLTGSVDAAVDSETAVKTGTLTGELSTGGFGNVAVSGTLNATPSGVYGVK